MNEKVSRLDIHKILPIKINTTKKNTYNGLLKRIILEYGYFLSKENINEDLEISIGPIKENITDYVILDNKYLIGDDWIYCSDSYKIAKWNILISNIENGKTHLHIDSNIFANNFIPSLLITPLIGMKLLSKGYVLAHGNSFSDEGKGIVITGFGSSGKTSAFLEAGKRGYDLLGDDHIILNNGKILSFPLAISLFKFNMPESVLTFKPWKYQVELKNLLYKMSFGYANLVTKVPIDKIFPSQIITETMLDKVILLEPSIETKYSLEKIELEELISSWSKNILFDAIYLHKYFQAYLYANPKSIMKSYEGKIKKSLKRNIGDCKNLFKLTYPLDNIKYVYKILEKNSETK